MTRESPMPNNADIIPLLAQELGLSKDVGETQVMVLAFTELCARRGKIAGMDKACEMMKDTILRLETELAGTSKKRRKS